MKSQQFSIYSPMISAQDDACGRTYHLHRAKPRGVFPKGRIWLVANQENAADNVYAEGGPGSDGFGGATLRFKLVDGTVVSLKGPWKTGAGALFADTGHDVRDKYLTRGIVAFERAIGKFGGADTFTEIVHYDDGPVLGTFDRVRQIALQAANDAGREVYFSFVSHGGGHAGSCKPGEAP